MLVRPTTVCLKPKLTSLIFVRGICALKVAVTGATGGVGQPLSLLLKQNPHVTKLSLHDLAKTPGIAIDLSHIPTSTKVEGFDGPSTLEKALEDADIVVICSGVSAKDATMKRAQLLAENCIIVGSIVKVVARVCPRALVAILSNPINCVVPVACEVMQKAGMFDPNKIFGITTLDVIRSSVIVGEVKGLRPEDVQVPVIGGHSLNSIIPVLSQTTPHVSFTESEARELTERIQKAGNEVIKLRSTSSTLSTAYATARFCSSLIRGLLGEQGVVECSYVRTDLVNGVTYFSCPLNLGPGGIAINLGLPHLSCLEREFVSKAVEELKKDITGAHEFMKTFQ